MFQHLLVPLDGSPLAEGALPLAEELAGKFDSQITLLRVIPPPYFTDNLLGASQEIVSHLHEQTVLEASKYLQAKVDNLQEKGCKVHSYVIEGDQVANCILETAYAYKADTIVMSTHGRGGVEQWVYGSIADKLLQRAEIPIVLTRSQ